MATYAEMTSELLGHISELDYLMAGRLLNRAWRDVRDSRLWSWLIAEGVFVAPPLIGQIYNAPPQPGQGTVTVTQYTNLVHLDSLANAALNNLTNPLITSRQFRCGPTNGGVYNIISYSNSAATLTLDRIYQEPSATGQPYQVYRCYYQPCDANGSLITDFLSFISMINPDLGYRISRSHLRYTKVEIDNMDPLRADQGLSYYVASYKYDTANGVPLYELWPHPTQSSGYVYLMRRRGLPFVKPSDTQPLQIPSELIVTRALHHCCMWAEKNKGKFPTLRASDWRWLATQHDTSYKEMLREAQRQDDEIVLETYLNSQYSDDLFLDEDMQTSTLLSTQSNRGWQGG